MALTPGDEAHHPPSDDPAWGEAWYFDFSAGVELSCFVQLMVRPAETRRRYWACLVRPEDLIAVIDDDVPPRAGNPLELRTHGLWADHIIEQPFDHVSVGCEAFALRLDPPLQMGPEIVGDRVAFGLDLGWETEGETGPVPVAGGYELRCEVHGEVLLGDERIDVAGAPGRRGHVWGVQPWADAWLTHTDLPAEMVPS